MGSSYNYQATIVKIVDGDTVKLDIDLGFKIHIAVTARLHGINAPEGKTTEASDYLKAQIPEGSSVRVETYKTADKYGRWLVDIYYNGDKLINKELIEKNLAVIYFHG